MAQASGPTEHGGEHDVTPIIDHQAQTIAAAVSQEQDAGPAGPEHEAGFGGTTDDMPNKVPPPAYGESFGTIHLEELGLGARATINDDGRININIDQKTSTLTTLLAPILRKQLLQEPKDQSPLPPAYIPPSLGGVPGNHPPPPPMNVVIHVVGSRGDVQPFVALGKVLKNTYGHRVRLATHPVFREFVTENGLEFFNIGGDPAELMAFMVKNPGLVPGTDALKSGDIGKRRKGMNEIIKRCWRSCFEAGDGSGAPASNDTEENYDDDTKPFVCDAIIANPPSFAHIHIAEKLGVPLHLMFTMPWSATQAFPHPLANIQSSNLDSSMTNFLTYPIVELLTWQGLGDLINHFREHTLGLEPISMIQAPTLVSKLRIPYTYCWSPALIPKPRDWKKHISVSGFYFLSLASNYTPANDLKQFLNAGPPPVYIGFGSIVLDDPNGMTKLIFEAVKRTGRRALVSKGWGGVGADELGKPDDVFMLGNVPHDWLFEHVSAVVHHGGAGTTAAGIAHSRPTVVVPFFGDQPFWGAMIAKAGAGPEPIPHKQLTPDKLANAINFALKPETLQRAKELGSRISEEKGCDTGGKSFHDAIEMDMLRCSVSPSRTAIWSDKKTGTKLSGFAAAVLGNQGLIDYANLRLFRYREYDTEDNPLEPFSGATSALVSSISGVMMGVADIPMDLFKSAKKDTPNAAQRQSNSSQKDNPTTAKDAGTTSPTPRFEPQKEFSPEDMLNAGKGVGRIVSSGVGSYMNFTMALAKGFHNAPRLYGDTTVRPHEKISGFQSGLKAAGKEFAFGMGDGISGLVTQPLQGAQKEGFSGFMKGFGKGIGGIMLKPAAAVWGIPAYTWKGVWAEMKKHMGASVENYIIASRVAQGFDEIKRATPEECEDVIQRWNSLLQTPVKRKWWKKKDPVIDQAIDDSVAATSTGDAEQDNHVKRAIQASIEQLQEASISGVDDEELKRAIQASVREAPEAHSQEEFDAQIALAMQKSLREGHNDIDSDNDENIKQAIRQSQTQAHSSDNTTTQAVSSEEEERIVLEYVKKQSLLEQQARKN